MDLKTLAFYLGLTDGGLRKALRDKNVNVVRLSGKYLIELADLDRLKKPFGQT